jgi:cell division septum initiation protein DivIVA
VTEITVKLVVNGILTGVAAIALAKLIPYNLQQRDELSQLQAEVTEVQQRVDLLQADLDRQFDPQQASSIMQEQSYRVDPYQRQVVWLSPHTKTAESASETAQKTAQHAAAHSPDQSVPQPVPQAAETNLPGDETAAYLDSDTP